MNLAAVTHHIKHSTSDTPTSTTTSLSALSTTAIKDGHRGHLPPGPNPRGHQHNPSITSLEAERADRISRLAGLERVSTLRAPPPQQQSSADGPASLSPQTTPTSTGFPTNFPLSQNLTPSYFDVHGQPVAVTKMSTVGTASATASHSGEGEGSRHTAGDRDEDMISMTDTNYREGGSVTSTGAEPDTMEEDLDGTAHSVGGYEDRMSDDGSASLVGFGEGANSTVSGPIYHRRVLPGSSQSYQVAPLGPERTVSGLSDIRRDRDRDVVMGSNSDTPVSAAAIQERRDARMMDGVAYESSHPGYSYEPETFVDTTFRGPVPTTTTPTRQQNRDTAERIVQLIDGEGRTGAPALATDRANDRLGKFSFEGEK